MIQIANAPCFWGALEFELEGKSLGYEQVLAEMVETGQIGIISCAYNIEDTTYLNYFDNVKD